MSAYNLLRAKSIRDEQPEDNNLLLKDHILQTIKRLEKLYAYTEENKKFLTNPWIKEDDKREQLFTAIVKALFLHDLGKIDAGFQRKLFNEYEEAEKRDWKELCNIFKWEKFPRQHIKRHEYLSLFWSYFLLDDDKEKEWNGKIRTAVLFHHYNQFYTNAEKELLEIIRDDIEGSEKYLEFLVKNKTELEKFLKLVINDVKERAEYDFTRRAMDKLETAINFDKLDDLCSKIMRQSPDIGVEMYDPETTDEEGNKVFILVSGILKRCDHSASAEISIEKIDKITPLFDRMEENITNGIKETATGKNFWQRKILEDANIAYPLLIAPTGSGKTEFALLWAKKRQRKLIYTLPLRVALNDLFVRFQTYTNKNKAGEEIEESIVSLLHSTSFIQYLEQEKSGTYGAHIDQKLNISRNIATPLILTTPDQVFLTALNFHGADKLKSIYPFSAIVVDEIQAYDPEMAAIIVKSLQDIRELGGNILIMTATYPPYFRVFLSDFKEIELKDPQNIKNYNVRRHKVELIDATFEQEKGDENKPEETFASKEFQEKLNMQVKIPDKNILVICNTVGNAIKAYEFIRKKYHEEKYVRLLHSRLIENVKQKRVNEIKDMIKKKLEGKDSGRVILVATQIVEASVDVDFDVLLTEISPVDTQIQRWGRVFRNRKDKQDAPLNYVEIEPNIIIFTKPNRITNLIYDKHTVAKTIEQFNETDKRNDFSQPLMYEDEKRLVDQTFDRTIENGGKTLKRYYEEQIKYLIKNLGYFLIEKRSEAQRMFRKIAGLSFVFPDIMEIDDSDPGEAELKRAFAPIIRDKGNKDLSWKEIVRKIRETVNYDGDDKRLMWSLRKLLNSYSINIPLYHTDRRQESGQYLRNHEFKGSYVFLVQDNKKKKEILEHGIDKVENIDNSLQQELSNIW